MKPKYVYHGSGTKIKGTLILKQAFDLGKNSDNTKKGIYASDHKEEAIVMGILKCKSIKGASVHIQKIKHKLIMDAVIYGGSIKQNHFYLYTLSSKNFKNIPKGSPQWISSKSVKPIKVEKLLVKDYIYLVRKATKEEKEEWWQEHSIKSKKRGKNV